MFVPATNFMANGNDVSVCDARIHLRQPALNEWKTPRQLQKDAFMTTFGTMYGRETTCIADAMGLSVSEHTSAH